MPPTEVIPDSLRAAGVTRREVEVFWLVVARLHNREIAERLYLSERTVESHVSSLLGKLNAPTRQALIEFGAKLRTGDRGGGLRRSLTSFVGRSKELEELHRLISAHRVTTLVGPAGAGKTRLALQLAETADAMPAPRLVDLAVASPGAEVERLFADALGVVASGPELRNTLRDVLANAPHLLIVDNCEHVTRPTASLLAELLGSSDQLRVLATSHGPLHVSGEVVYRVDPLPLPTDSEDPSAVLSSASVRLFVDRAATAFQGFSITPENAGDVAELCRRLDGLPLAIELAAARVRVFSPAELLARLDDRFALLADGGKGPGSRHVSLEGALRWSYELLDDDERLLYERCSVFPGGFDYDSAADILAYPPLARSDLARIFPRLLDRSLVGAIRHGEVTEYRMLDSIRQFATSRLADRAEHAAALERHARYHLSRAPALIVDLQGRDQPAALSWFERHWVDLRAAMAWALGAGHTDAAWEFMSGVGTGWEILGMRGELFEWLDALLESPLPSGRLGIRAAATSAILLWYQDRVRAAELADRSLRQAVDGEPRDMAFARFAVGLTRPLLEPTDGADADPRSGGAPVSPLLLDVAGEFERLGDDWHRALALRQLGSRGEDLESALRHLDIAAEVFGQLQDLVSRANSRFLMGAACVDAGVRLDDADRWLSEARRLAERAGSRHEWLHAELFAAQLAQHQVDAASTRGRFAALVPEFRRIGDRRCLGRSLLGLGVAVAAEGDLEAARHHLHDCLLAVRSVDHATSMAAALRLLAGFDQSAGNAWRAATLLGAADAVTDRLEPATRQTLPPDRDLRAALERHLGPQDLAAALDEGRRTPIEAIIPIDPRS
jgi:predicted ATPase/DNA-binding CsgD family transcriptional regulator